MAKPRANSKVSHTVVNMTPSRVDCLVVSMDASRKSIGYEIRVEFCSEMRRDDHRGAREVHE
jgi:hypothetical protein